jgi:insulysin
MSYYYFSNADLTDSLDHLSELVSNLFSPIPNRGRDPLPSIPDHPFGPDEKGVRLIFTTHLCYWLYQL